MFFKITLLIIILIIFYLLIEFSTEKENFTNKIRYAAKNNLIENFIAYPDKQPFCANLFSSRAKYWSKLPNKFCKGLYVKYCCRGCYYKICKSITCSKNKNGLFKVDKLINKDIENLRKYYDKINKKNNRTKLDFEFNEKKLKKLIGKPILKYRNDEIHYPIQVLKYNRDMDRFDITNDKLLKKKYNCKKKKK